MIGAVRYDQAYRYQHDRSTSTLWRLSRYECIAQLLTATMNVTMTAFNRCDIIACDDRHDDRAMMTATMNATDFNRYG
jgi:hypothetical protein